MGFSTMWTILVYCAIGVNSIALKSEQLKISEANVRGNARLQAMLDSTDDGSTPDERKTALLARVGNTFKVSDGNKNMDETLAPKGKRCCWYDGQECKMYCDD